MTRTGSSSQPPHRRPVGTETTDIDASWDDLDSSAPREPSVPPRTDDEEDVFDRDTAIPALSPEDLARNMMVASETPSARPPSERATPIASQPPDGTGAMGEPPVPPDPPRLEIDSASFDSTRAPGPDANLPQRGAEEKPTAATRRPASSDRTRTAPEPVVERYRERASRGLPELAGQLERRQSGEVASLELQLDSALEAGSALDLVDRRAQNADSAPNMDVSPPPPEGSNAEPGTNQDMQDRYAVGDFTGALVVAESILEAQPDDEDARRYAQSCREVLTQMYAARLGALDQLVSVAVPSEQITWLSLDHRAGFLLSLVDGASTIEEILDISGMTRLEALRIMYTLVQQNVINVG